MADFTEIADRIWVARHPWLDVNVTLIAGSRGLVVVDTLASTVAAEAMLQDVRRVSAAPIVAAINTHDHFDHCFGNAVFASDEVELIAHESAAATMAEHAQRVQSQALLDATTDSAYGDVAQAAIVVPTTTFSSARVVDLGDRQLELIHPGRGHTSGDLIVRIPDADTVLAGDLIEESAERAAVPGFGDDCYPFEWPLTLDIVLALTTARSVVLPGHGAPVDRDFVENQRNDIGILAETIRDLAGRGVPVHQALAEGVWPFPEAELGDAVRRGYEHLPRSQKRLPLI
jgi:glyoxylase-like metal-dependent hydrolase (beta-lactamase superfamily II)